MSEFPDTELQQSETVVAELIENPQASIGKQDGIGNNNVARMRSYRLLRLEFLCYPLPTLLLNRAHLLPKPSDIYRSALWPHEPLERCSGGGYIRSYHTSQKRFRKQHENCSSRPPWNTSGEASPHLQPLADRHDDLMGSLLLRLTVDASGKVVSVDPISFTGKQTPVSQKRGGRCAQVEIPQSRIGSCRNNSSTIVCPERNGSGHGCSVGTQSQERTGRRNASSRPQCRQ